MDLPGGVEPVSGVDFFSFDYLDRYEEVERYWAKKPYSYVSILYDPEEDDLLYHVNEPSMSGFQHFIASDVNEVLRNAPSTKVLPKRRSARTSSKRGWRTCSRST